MMVDLRGVIRVDQNSGEVCLSAMKDTPVASPEHKKPRLSVGLFVFMNGHHWPAGAEITCPSL
jgi:hypothetical protein